MQTKLYLDDPYLREFEAAIAERAGGWWALTQTAFYPGGGGQPHDRGSLTVNGQSVPVTAVRADDGGQIWHQVGGEAAPQPAPGEAVRGAIDWTYRHALMRHHGLLHVVNTVARERYGGVITGAQIGPERSRIDLKLSGFSREQLPELEAAVNEVIGRVLAVRASAVSEEEFRSRPELVRTLDVLPPVIDGRVRVVEMVGFDAQACGGTHVHSTGEIGRARIEKFDNKGKDNKRFYWTLQE